MVSWRATRAALAEETGVVLAVGVRTRVGVPVVECDAEETVVFGGGGGGWERRFGAGAGGASVVVWGEEVERVRSVYSHYMYRYLQYSLFWPGWMTDERSEVGADRVRSCPMLASLWNVNGWWGWPGCTQTSSGGNGTALAAIFASSTALLIH